MIFIWFKKHIGPIVGCVDESEHMSTAKGKDVHMNKINTNSSFRFPFI